MKTFQLNGKTFGTRQVQFTKNIYTTEVFEIAPPVKTGIAWKDRRDLMDRLTTVQNLHANRHRDIMTFAGFMATEPELEAYVAQQEQRAA